MLALQIERLPADRNAHYVAIGMPADDRAFNAQEILDASQSVTFECRHPAAMNVQCFTTTAHCDQSRCLVKLHASPSCPTTAPPLETPFPATGRACNGDRSGNCAAGKDRTGRAPEAEFPGNETSASRRCEWGRRAQRLGGRTPRRSDAARCPC